MGLQATPWLSGSPLLLSSPSRRDARLASWPWGVVSSIYGRIYSRSSNNIEGFATMRRWWHLSLVAHLSIEYGICKPTVTSHP